MQDNGETWALGGVEGGHGTKEGVGSWKGAGFPNGGRERGVSAALGIVQSRALRVCTRSANLGPRFR